MNKDAALLACRDLTVSVPGRTLVEGLSLELVPGEFLAVLGRNGTGKTLTLHTLAGLRAPAAGEVRLRGERLEALPRRRIARELALLTQTSDDVFPATVLETVLIGRHPHIATFGRETGEDRRIAREALERVSLAELVAREVGTLSGGERRRVAVAQVLAQAPAICLLDEPTNHLDPQHQLEVLEVFRARAEAGAAVVASLHDVNLAVRYARHCLLLFGDGRWELGRTGEVLEEARLSALYRTPMEALRWRERNVFVIRGRSDFSP
jgi:iron complex transport system ATP-binding protein